MPPDAPDCPDTETFHDLLAGRLPAARFAQVEAHVGNCGACGALVAHLAASQAASHPADTATGVDPRLPPGFGAPQPGATPAPTFALIDRDRFEVVRQIARGGMGRVVEAWDRRHERVVALKTLLHPDAGMRARFAREARITGRLQHPGIVPLYETGRWSDDEPFIVMKLVRGEPLDRIVAMTPRRQRLGLLPNVIAMTEALAFAHRKGVLHRDLKPANVLVGSFGETIVVDWGLAKVVGEPDAAGEPQAQDIDPLSVSPSLTRAGVAIGTPYYMPPEQARAEPVDARADVYALGALLYHVLAGEPPYAGSAGGSVLDRVRAGPPQPLGARVPDLPPDLLTIVDKAMSRDPGARYPDAHAMAADLRRFEAGQLVAAHTYSLGTLIARWIARHRAIVAMAAALVVAVGLTAGFFVRYLVIAGNAARAAETEAVRERAKAVAQRDSVEKLVGYLIGELQTRLTAIGKLDLLVGLGDQIQTFYSKVGHIGYAPLAVVPSGIDPVIDPKKADGDLMRTSVAGIARKWKYDAVWWSLSYEAVHADGSVDLHGATVKYASPSSVAATYTPLNRDALKDFAFGPDGVDFAHSGASSQKASNGDVHAPAMPACGIKQLARSLQPKGLTGSKTVRITYSPETAFVCPAEPSWIVKGDNPKIAGCFSMATCAEVSSPPR